MDIKKLKILFNNYIKSDSHYKYINIFYTDESKDKSFTYKNFYKIIKKIDPKIVVKQTYYHKRNIIDIEFIMDKDKYEYISKLINKYCEKFTTHSNHVIWESEYKSKIYWRLCIKYKGIHYKLKSLSNIFRPTLNTYISNNFKTYYDKFFIYYDNKAKEKYIKINNFYNLIKDFKSNIKLYETQIAHDNGDYMGKQVRIEFLINKKQYDAKCKLLHRYCYVHKYRYTDDIYLCVTAIKIVDNNPFKTIKEKQLGNENFFT